MFKQRFRRKGSFNAPKFNKYSLSKCCLMIKLNEVVMGIHCLLVLGVEENMKENV